MSTHQHRTDMQLVLTLGEPLAERCRRAGLRHVKDASHPRMLLDGDGRVAPGVEFFGSYVILIDPEDESARDDIAICLGDERCRWAYWPENDEDLPAAIAGASRMWIDEISTMRDIPDPGVETTYESGFYKLDAHGFRITTPAFMPIIGPYGSGKSVFLRQLLVNLYQKHGWKFLLTSFEEKVKPRYERDLRRHFIGRPMVDRKTGEMLWSDEQIKKADAEIQKAAVFLRRKRSAVLDLDRLINRLEFAVRVHGVKVVAIDPVNEIDHQVPKGESKTDYMGRFIMRLKALADDYNLLMICCAHPPKDGVEKRLSKNGLLTLNDGADTAHWGNKADIGFCLWRNIEGPSLLHCDKLKDHETNGKPFLCELILDEGTNSFMVGRIGYHIIGEQEASK
jgi:hypothetical protein